MIRSNENCDSQIGALLLKVEEVAAMLGLSERTVWRLASSGEFPQPIKLGRSVRWARSTIEKFVEAKTDEVALSLK